LAASTKILRAAGCGACITAGVKVKSPVVEVSGNDAAARVERNGLDMDKLLANML